MPSPNSSSVPIGRTTLCQRMWLVRNMALNPYAELYEEAADKNKRWSCYYGVKTSMRVLWVTHKVSAHSFNRKHVSAFVRFVI